MRTIFLTIFIVFFCVSVKAQKPIDKKYLLSLIYLKTNEFANEEIKRVFSNSTKLRKKEKFIEFNIQDEVRFLHISLFRHELKEKDYGLNLNEELLHNRELYRKEYEFARHSHGLLDKIIPHNDSDLVLVFSKPVQNYVIAELLDAKYTSNGRIDMGPSIQFLFIFNENGLIENVVFSYNYYN